MFYFFEKIYKWRFLGENYENLEELCSFEKVSFFLSKFLIIQ